MLLVAFYFVLNTVAEVCTGDQLAACGDSQCETLNSVQICFQCRTEGNVPIDGVCTPKNEVGDKCKKAGGGALDETAKVCGECSGNYFLHKGGCYSVTTDKPGHALCTATENGVCTQGADGYFAVPGAPKTGESVVACNNNAGTSINGNMYKGVQNCATCQPPAGPAAVREDTIAVCKSCLEGFFHTDERTCTACGGTNCAICTIGATEKMCTKCKITNDEQYLKKDIDSETGECVSAATCIGNAKYYVDDTVDPTNGKTCKTCASAGTIDCTTCEKGVDGIVVCKTCETEQKTKFGLGKKSCVEACPENSTESDEEGKKVCKCNTDFKPSEDFTKCIVDSACKTPYCKTCSNDVCTMCASGYYLTPTSQCISDCTTIKGYYGDSRDKKCKGCNSECTECVGAANTQCSACRAGKMLQYTKPNTPIEGGTCVDQCTVSSEAAGCETCGAKIGGTDYCSKCKEEQVPINGVCAENSAASRANICTSNNNGGCTGCADGYFLFANGCYKIGQQPGKQICAQANGSGECQKCANGLQAQGGDCSAYMCHPTCATCSAANQENKCTTCATGYYKTTQEGACTSCESDSNGVTGVRNCLNCAPPSTGSGSVLCYLMKGGDSTGGSTNRSGLSTGAIAGIAVAAIVVVGGLVGFLCWWFLCRGKA
ncbi:VSP [Giardia lamblia P15]|uniref:VSP n=1 Tax=Giardia intestinalis (strain P15) TaxID=658858 RepID=E1F8E1_GIAIA|nr:VSP [Giardia lamblia P15]